MTNKAYVYCRTAPAGICSNNLLIRQMKPCFEYAHRHKYRVVRIAVENGMGISANSSGFLKMLKECQVKKIGTVIVLKVECFRSLKSYGKCKEMLDRAGIKLVFVDKDSYYADYLLRLRKNRAKVVN